VLQTAGHLEPMKGGFETNKDIISSKLEFEI